MYYLYDSLGRVTNEFSAYNNSAPPASGVVPSVVTNLCKLTTYDYNPVAGATVGGNADDGSKTSAARTETVVLPALVGGTWQAQEVSRTYSPDAFTTRPRRDQQCPVPGTNAVWGGPGNLLTLTWNYGVLDQFGDPLDPAAVGQIQSVSRPDGTVTLYGYSSWAGSITTDVSTWRVNRLEQPD